MIEAMKQLVEALTNYDMLGVPEIEDAIAAGRQAIAKAEKQEPVAWRWETHNGYAYSEEHYEGENGQPLYTHPQPKREPLTDEQIHIRYKAMRDYDKPPRYIEIYRDCEAAHGIKETK